MASTHLYHLAMSLSQLKKLNHSKYRPDIDGLRAIAVLAVLAFHAFPGSFKGGFIGVDVFFVISGYLISTIIFEELDRGNFRPSNFYARRIKRLFPALILVMTACLAFSSFLLLADEFNQFGKHIAAGSSFISNFVFWNESGYFDNAVDTKPLLHLWSLGIEEQFYLVWPLFLWFSWKQKFSLFLLIVLIASASFVLNIIEIKTDIVAAFYSPQTRFWELLSGSLLAWLIHYKQGIYINLSHIMNGNLLSKINKQTLLVVGNFLPNVMSLCGLLLLAYGFWRITKDLSFPGKWALIPVIGTVLFIAAGSQAFINRKILSSKVLVWFGLISFPLYLWHWPILSFARIYENEVPSTNIRIAAVFLSIVLAWLTYKWLEIPIRSGKQSRIKVTILCGLVFMMGVSGFVVYKSDFSQSHTYEKLLIKRKGSEHAFGYSLAWFRGKNDWLFLGNSYDRTVAKLKLAIVPSDKEIKDAKEIFAKISRAGAQFNTKIVLMVAPDKSSVYPEYLPDELIPSPKKYSSFFLDNLKDLPGLTVYNPTDNLLQLKKTEGILYWRTDTHWNSKGAFLAYADFLKLFDLPVPQVEFQHGSTHSGDLIKISGLKNFPLYPDDNWNAVWKKIPILTENLIPNEQKTAFGAATIVTNQTPLSNKYIWVIGDSFSGPLRQYLNGTFKEVRYVGHWEEKLKDLHVSLENAEKKPDMIVIIKAERFF